MSRGRAAQAAAPQAAPARHPRICFERIVPEDLDADHLLRRALNLQAGTAGDRSADAPATDGAFQRARMALLRAKVWPPGSTLRCRFLDGSAAMRAKVRTHAAEWEARAHVRFQFVSRGAAEIRISFYADAGSWSALGRDALNTAYFPLHQPTMNLGWVRDDSDPVEDRAVVLHEFGHALGCLREHQSPTFNRQWNEAAVMAYFKGPPNFWNTADIRSNVLKRYSPKSTRATRFDPRSIMLYAFDAALFADGAGPTNENTRLSAKDKAMIRQLYPGP